MPLRRIADAYEARSLMAFRIRNKSATIDQGQTQPRTAWKIRNIAARLGAWKCDDIRNKALIIN